MADSKKFTQIPKEVLDILKWLKISIMMMVLAVFLLSGALHVNVMVLPKQGWSCVGIAKFWERIASKIRIIVLFFPAATIASFCQSQQLRTGICFRLMVFKPFFMVPSMMWRSTYSPEIDIPVRQERCLNFAKLCMVCIRLL